MKTAFRALLLLLVLLSGMGSTAQAADEAMIASYTAYWKSLLAESSGISEAALDPLIQVEGTEIRTWNSGKAFHVRYNLKIDWLTTKREDRFVVWLNSSESAYQHLGLARDVWFSGPEVRIAVAKQLFDSTLGKVDPALKPAFGSLEAAKDFVLTNHKLTGFSEAKVAFYVPGKVPREDGHPYLIWSSVLDEKANKLLEGYLNLITKAEESHENAIRFYGAPSGRGIVGGE